LIKIPEVGITFSKLGLVCHVTLAINDDGSIERKISKRRASESKRIENLQEQRQRQSLLLAFVGNLSGNLFICMIVTFISLLLEL
jgi:hypothetical protein